MIKARQSGLFVAITLAVLYSTPARACPSCNIHNYLAISIRSSTNIYHGKVVSQIDDRTAEVEVLKVLRGEHKVGSKVKTKMYGSKKYIGKKFIFSDPTSWPPTFEVLQLEFEDEVLFLIQEKKAVSDVQEAVKRIQGVSVLTQKIGMEYITDHYDEAVAPLIAEMDTLIPKVFATNDVFFGKHRLDKLAKALLVRNSESAKKFVFARIDELAKQKQEQIDWAWVPHNASSRGVFIKDLISHSQKHEDLVAPLHKRLISELPRLSGIMLADSTYAILVSELDTVDAVQKVLGSNGSADMVALGLYFAGNDKSRWGQHEKAYAFWDKALSIAKRKELKDAISKSIKRSQRFNKRKMGNTNKAMDSDKKM